MGFQHNINQLMNEKFISNYRLAKVLNVHATTVANWRKGKQSPQINHIGRIAEYFGCTIEELMGGDDS
ncbi:MAG: helix-turn-helix transcriptional regulator [Bacteroidales bacterium]|nr:helix-turn-helix transcriptional regulator [Bacteroidales bacterium]